MEPPKMAFRGFSGKKHRLRGWGSHCRFWGHLGQLGIFTKTPGESPSAAEKVLEGMCKVLPEDALLA
jgi:hypothetical protein